MTSKSQYIVNNHKENIQNVNKSNLKSQINSSKFPNYSENIQNNNHNQIPANSNLLSNNSFTIHYNPEIKTDENLSNRINSKFSLSKYNPTKSIMSENKRYSVIKEEEKENINLEKSKNEEQNISEEEFHFPPQHNENVAESNNNNNNNNNNSINTKKSQIKKIRNPFDSISESTGDKFKSNNKINNWKSSYFRKSLQQNLESITNNKFNNIGTNISDINLQFEIAENIEEEIRYTNCSGNNQIVQSSVNNNNVIISSLNPLGAFSQKRESKIPFIKVDPKSIVNYITNSDGKIYNNNFSKLEISKRICNIVHNIPFEDPNSNIINLTLSGIKKKNILDLNENELDEQLEKEFYDNIKDMKQFDNITKKLHNIRANDNTIDYLRSISTIKEKVNNSNMKEFYRMSFMDGNSLYKLLLFGYFERIILRKNLFEFKSFVYELLIRMKSLNYIEASIIFTIVFHIIISHLKKGQIEEGYNVLYNAFALDKTFLESLIIYLKLSISEAIGTIKNKFKKEIWKDIIPIAYFNQKGNLEEEKLIKEQIMPLGNSNINHLLLYIFPQLYEINITIIIEGTNEEITFSSLNKTSNEYITLSYSHFNYRLIYQYSYFNIYKDILINHVLQNNNKSNNAYISIIPNKTKCNECSSESPDLIIINNTTEPICKNCLIDGINTYITHITENIISQIFLNIEYYCAPIPLLKNDINELYHLFANDDSISLLYSNNKSIGELIYNEIIKRIKCSKCSNNPKSKLFCLSCGCLYCEECIKEKILTTTNNRVILNEYEKEKINYKCDICHVNNITINNDIIKQLFNINQLQTKSRERLYDKMLKVCCICDVNSNFDYFIRIIIGNDKVKFHALCNKCKDDLDKKIKTGDAAINCILCKIIHPYKPIDLIPIKQNKNESINNNLFLENENNLKENNESIRIKRKSKVNKCCLVI